MTIQLFKSVMETDEILEALRPVLQSGWTGLGAKVGLFEIAMAKFLGVQDFVATNSCTAALQLAVRSLDLLPGSKVATTPISFVATNMVLLYEGLIPVFVDVDPKTGNMDPFSLADALEEHSDIKAAMVVHLGGYPADMAKIRFHARKLPIIEDAAHALGATYSHTANRVGNSENMACFSFHSVKNLPIGDGGGVATNDLDLAARLRRMRWFGITKSTAERSVGKYDWEYDVKELGFKAHMNDVAATIGLVMLDKLAVHNTLRRRVALRYREYIYGGEHPNYAGDFSSYHFYPMFFRNRDMVMAALREAGIQFGHHYKRNDEYPVFSHALKTGAMIGTTEYTTTELTLPIHPGLSESDVAQIIEVVNAQGHHCLHNVV